MGASGENFPSRRKSKCKGSASRHSLTVQMLSSQENKNKNKNAPPRRDIHYCICTVIHGAAASTSNGSLLEIRNFRSCSRSAEFGFAFDMTISVMRAKHQKCTNPSTLCILLKHLTLEILYNLKAFGSAAHLTDRAYSRSGRGGWVSGPHARSVCAECSPPEGRSLGARLRVASSVTCSGTAAFRALRPRVPGGSGAWAADPDAPTAVSSSLRFGVQDPTRPTRGGAHGARRPAPRGAGRGLLGERSGPASQVACERLQPLPACPNSVPPLSTAGFVHPPRCGSSPVSAGSSPPPLLAPLPRRRSGPAREGLTRGSSRRGGIRRRAERGAEAASAKKMSA
ncbi:LOW QUALITY PROTEIN: uncharacterized protein LOC141582216 [Saimiri boliviensis]|uniref:LOW QUALITY PROTEIN: uncharacterized protein LOC141582216 n=1 Tax=Saimiri boliviensis TaxID=27679 RepID=UPI003D789379